MSKLIISVLVKHFFQFFFYSGTPAQRKAKDTDEFSKNLKKKNEEEMFALLNQVTPGKGKQPASGSGFTKSSGSKTAGPG